MRVQSIHTKLVSSLSSRPWNHCLSRVASASGANIYRVDCILEVGFTPVTSQQINTLTGPPCYV